MTFPVQPPREWFFTPEPNQRQPLTIDASGHVTGHLAPWDCHAGFNECVRPPHTRDGYKDFHTGTIETADGELVPVGKIMYGDKGHADINMGLAAASRHYDNNNYVGAYVRAVDGKHGIWLSGALRPDIGADGLRELRANPPSGDWRRDKLIAATAVPIPGFPIGHDGVALVASGETMILAWNGDNNDEEETMEPRSKEFLRKRSLIAAGLVAAPLTARSRKALSRGDFAIPEQRAYPIHDEAHARNALARSSGKPEEARVRRAVCRRYPDMGECKS